MKQFSVKKNVWKGVLAALLSAVTIMLLTGVDALFSVFMDSGQLAAIGLPAAAIPLIIGLVEMGRNWWKHAGRAMFERWLKGLGA